MRHPTIHSPEAVYRRDVRASWVSRYQQNLCVISISMEQHVSLKKKKKKTPGRGIKMKWDLKWILARRREAKSGVLETRRGFETIKRAGGC